MQSTGKLIVFGLALMLLASPAFAETSAQEPSVREQFQAAVTAYQMTPGRDTALLLILLYSQLDPPPAVPEEAREPFVMATTVFTESRDSAGIAKAIKLLDSAIFIAPYWSEARYNRAIAYEAASQFATAIDELKLYLGFNLAEAERRAVQDRIYALKAKAEIATAREAEQRRIEAARITEENRAAAAEAAAQAAAERDQLMDAAIRSRADAMARLRPSIEGTWSYGGWFVFSIMRTGERFTVSGIKWGTTSRISMKDVVADQEHVKFTCVQHADGSSFQMTFDLTISPDGKGFTGTLWNREFGTREIHADDISKLP